jgi:hypothetical protein
MMEWRSTETEPFRFDTNIEDDNNERYGRLDFIVKDSLLKAIKEDSK